MRFDEKRQASVDPHAARPRHHPCCETCSQQWIQVASASKQVAVVSLPS